MQEELEYLQGDPKVIFFTDFDGTVTLQDCKTALL
jgi:2-hydroxy-3-keto-5-methylthiopentenyl-1-phosphate phosphatase